MIAYSRWLESILDFLFGWTFPFDQWIRTCDPTAVFYLTLILGIGIGFTIGMFVGYKQGKDDAEAERWGKP